jgi:hypothetical protein
MEGMGNLELQSAQLTFKRFIIIIIIIINLLTIIVPFQVQHSGVE